MRTEDRYAARPIDLQMRLLILRGRAAPGAGIWSCPIPDLCTGLFLAVAAAEVALDGALPGLDTTLEALAPPAVRIGLALAEAFSRRMKERFLP